MSAPTPATPEQVRQRHTEAQRANAERAAVVVGSALAAARAGTLPPDDLRPLLKFLITQSVTFARRLADLATAAELSVTVGRPVAPVGLDEDETTAGTVSLGVDTILDDDADALAGLLDDPDDLDDDIAALDEPDDDETPDNVVSLAEARAKRLARNASLQAGQRATQEALDAQGVTYWKRETDGEACPQCQALADGRVIPVRKGIVTHPNCGCTLQPTNADGDPLGPEFEPIKLIDLSPTVQPARTFSTGHGLGRREYSQLPSGFRVERSAPKTKPADRWKKRQ